MRWDERIGGSIAAVAKDVVEGIQLQRVVQSAHDPLTVTVQILIGFKHLPRNKSLLRHG